MYVFICLFIDLLLLRILYGSRSKELQWRLSVNPTQCISATSRRHALLQATSILVSPPVLPPATRRVLEIDEPETSNQQRDLQGNYDVGVSET